MRLGRALRISTVIGGVCGTAALATPTGAVAQDSPPASGQSQARHMSVSWAGVPIGVVLRAFAVYAGVSIVASSSVSGPVTADINDQPWDVALRTILSAYGFYASEDEYGIIRVDTAGDLNDREAVEPVVTRSYRISYSRAAEIQTAIAPLLTTRGSVSVVEASNTLIVSDVARVQGTVAALLR